MLQVERVVLGRSCFSLYMVLGGACYSETKWCQVELARECPNHIRYPCFFITLVVSLDDPYQIISLGMGLFPLLLSSSFLFFVAVDVWCFWYASVCRSRNICVHNLLCICV